MSAVQKETVINTTSYSVTFHVTINAVGDTKITSNPQYRLRVLLSSTDPTEQDQQVIVQPSVKDGTKSYFYKKSNGELGSNPNTLDQNNVFPLTWIHGDIYFVVPKTRKQFPAAQFVELA